MSNKHRTNNAIRTLAVDAKKRLAAKEYSKLSSALEPPGYLTPSQKAVYLKLRDCFERGEEIVSPLEQLADKNLLSSLPHEERQRYIFGLCSDYVEMKRELMGRIASCSVEQY